jgi:hypothetical protein
VAVFNPAADAYANAGAPDTNYGASTILRTWVSPEQRSYLRFDVTGLAGQTITRATLRVYANGSSSAGFTVAGVPDITWSEATVTYNAMPALGSPLNTSGAHGGAQYVSIDVTGYVTGDGLYSFALTTTSTKAVSYPGREAGSNRPDLVIEYAPVSGSDGNGQTARGAPWGVGLLLVIVGVVSVFRPR